MTPDRIGASIHRCFIYGKNLVSLRSAARRINSEILVILEMGFILIPAQQSEHASVFHIVTIDNRISVLQTLIFRPDKNSPGAVLLLLKRMVQIIIITGIPYDRITQIECFKLDPANHIFIRLFQAVKIHI